MKWTTSNDHGLAIPRGQASVPDCRPQGASGADGPIRVLMVGPLPPPIGGTTVLFQQLTDVLATRRRVILHTINTSRSAGGTKAILHQALAVFMQILRNARHSDIITFHASIRGGRLFAGVVRLASAVSRRRWLFRGFGGDFDLWYERASALQRLLFRITVLGAQCVLLETKSSVRYFQGVSRRPVRWYANSRPFPETPSGRHSGSPARKFVYVGHVKPCKGILELLQAADHLPDGVTVDIYGPMSEGLTAEAFRGRKSHYCGVLQPAQVSGVLTGYDVLVLPTYFEGEGYPGVILEAYTAGLPVIATRWRSIPEVVDTESGILIEPGDTAQLEEAMTLLINSVPIMDRLRSGALAKAKEFSSDVWADKFIDILQDLKDATRSPTIP